MTKRKPKPESGIWPRPSRLHQREPSKAAWIDAATAAALQAGVSPVQVMAGVRKDKICRARWQAWQAVIETHPYCSLAGIARVSGFHHTTIISALRRLNEARA